MYLTESNYYSKEADQEFLSVSQYKMFCGTPGTQGCEARAMAVLNGKWHNQTTNAMLIGSYVDAHFEGTLDFFKVKHSDLFRKDGCLKTDFQKAEEIIQRIEKDDFFMQCMSGEKQVIFTADLFGAKWKGKTDSYHTRTSPFSSIVDLKIVKDIHEKFYSKEKESFVSFIEFWGYDFQGAIYQLLEQANFGGGKVPFYIAAADKQKVPDLAVINIRQEQMDSTLFGIEENVQRIIAVKSGKAEPVRCEKCDYCKFTKKLTAPISTEMLIEV